MERFERALKLPNAQFKRIVGTTKAVFQKMLSVLQAAYDKLHEAGGKPPDLSVGDKRCPKKSSNRHSKNTMVSSAANFTIPFSCSGLFCCRHFPTRSTVPAPPPSLASSAFVLPLAKVCLTKTPATIAEPERNSKKKPSTNS